MEALAADAQQPIEVRAGNTLAGAIAIEQFVEPQLHHLVVLALEAVHATATHTTPSGGLSIHLIV